MKRTQRQTGNSEEEPLDNVPCSYVPIITGDCVCVPKSKERMFLNRLSRILRSKHGIELTQQHANMAAWVLQGELEEKFISYALSHDAMSPSRSLQAGSITDRAMSQALGYIGRTKLDTLMAKYDEHVAESEAIEAHLAGKGASDNGGGDV